MHKGQGRARRRDEQFGSSLSLGSIQAEIKKARTELERLKGENAKATAALEALTKKRAETEARVVTLENDARAATAERCRAQDMMEQVKAKLRSIAPLPDFGV